MKTILITIFAIVTLTGCASIDAKRLENSAKKYASAVEKICTTVEIFDSVGVEFPGVEQCEKVMKTMDIIKDKADALAITEVIACIGSHPVKSPDFAACVTESQDWSKIAKEISLKQL